MSPPQKQAELKRRLYRRALVASFLKLDPRRQIRKPVMFGVEVISLLLTGLWLWALVRGGSARVEAFTATVAVWLWLTVLFTNFAEALAEGHDKPERPQ